jgi:hypothetical protein
MELHTERQRRARNRPQQTTGVLVRTMHDARGIAEPLERYGELLACQIVDLYNAVHELPATSRHTLARLKQLFHESEGLPATRKILLRPGYQWRYGYNHQTIYRRAPGTGRFLLANGIYEQDDLRWAESTRIVQISADARQAPSDHDAALSLILASLEIAVRQCRELRFVTHLDIVRKASVQAQRAANPLSIPVPAVAHTFQSGRRVELADIHLNPDALFGIQYPPADDPDFRFFAVEYDRSTEDVEPTKNLVRASWLRKILLYSAVSQRPSPVYETYLKIPNLLVLCIFSDASRTTHVMRVVEAHANCPEQFLFKTIPPVDPFLNATSLPQLLHHPWQRLGGTFHIRTLEERR